MMTLTIENNRFYNGSFEAAEIKSAGLMQRIEQLGNEIETLSLAITNASAALEPVRKKQPTTAGTKVNGSTFHGSGSEASCCIEEQITRVRDCIEKVGCLVQELDL